MPHLAQLNVGRLLHPQNDPRVAPFMDNLAFVNALAERSPGFVWRLKDDSGNATSIRAFADPELILNLSVWESAADLRQFAFGTIHRQFFGRRAEWFQKMPAPHFVMWHVEPGHLPTLAEAAGKLALIEARGPTEAAFGWEGASVSLMLPQQS